MASQKEFGGQNEPIAVIGTACRFPGDSTTPSKLWELLRQPRDVLSEIPGNRFSPRGFYHPDPLHHGTSNVQHSYLLSEDPRLFDAQFFGIKPIEANSIDPQQRLLIETVYESIEAAGLSIEQLRGTQAGVYVGLMCADYESMAGRDIDNVPTYYATGTARSIISNRISYFFDWHGPSMTIDTACSSSLVAVHQAVQLLRSGDGTDVAIAAGANLLLSPDLYIAESKLKMLSADGRSHMWDDRANGYARGDGVAVIVMKRLSQALKDGDHIDCIIRETQINQDGRTKGITMPSATAQASLIRATYKKAGLDISKKSDRPQFFEAHGTGTPAGDPIEAEAIHTAFFGEQSVGDNVVDRLYVGSIKTVIGHTEGTAGLAALIKASLAIQNSTIPPNLLFNNLNPKVAPFYGPLEIATESQPWPEIGAECVRRASVNSFGFGGTNAHAILESADAYTAPYKPAADAVLSSSNVTTPFNFSATSESSLRAILQKYSEFLSQNDDINLRDLSWTLSQRRSTFPLRTSVYGSTALELSERLQAKAKADEKVLKEVVSKSLTEKTRILGVFTGQGAQWARMGAELLGNTHVATSILDHLEECLAELPDGPSWSIKNEILAEGKSSRINEAEISQPTCTAVQILLVDILFSAGIKFEAVVGHSSGEIGAAYAAGYLTAKDAIRIAYYRGMHLHLAGGPNGEKGAMMAVGTSFQDAQELCEMPELKGRINIAASNSFSSVTLSGDADAVEEAQGVLEDEKKFARLLKVDKAYHSHHMLSCSDAYMKSLVDCNIKVLRPRSGTTWISSVYNEDAANYREILKDEYWVSNMVSPVMFSQATETAIAESGPFDIGIECGPHPALKGPVLQVIQEVLGEVLPYTGLLSRGKNDNQAIAEGLGYLWQSLGDHAVDYGAVDKFLAGPDAAAPKMLVNLPSYVWDHDRVYLHESRQYAAYRTRPNASHELLGVIVPDGTKEQLRWRNMIRPREVPWISGHQIQGQMVFPAAGYLSSALSALQFAADGVEMKLVEIEDFVIGQAMVFNDEYTSVETQFVLGDISKTVDSLTASFSFFSASTKDPMLMVLNASGRVTVEFGDSEEEILPRNSGGEYNMFDVDSELFYGTLTGLGFGYTGPFKALESLQRKLGQATGIIKSPASTDPAYNLMLHPAALDAAIQSIILAYCYPDDGRMLSIHLPTSVKKIRINPALCELTAGQEVSLHFKSTIKDDRSVEIDGDVDIYDEQGQNCILQLEGLHTKPLSHSTSANDTRLFFELTWDVETLNKEMAVRKMPNLEHQTQLSFDLERVAYYYLRNLDRVASKADRENTEWHHKIFFEYIDYVLDGVKNGTALFSDKKWMDDTYEEIQDLIDKYPEHIGMKLMRAVGEHLAPVIRGETTMLQYMTEDNMLNEFYVSAVGFQEYTDSLAEQVGKLGHRFPHMNVLEIGAGTGGATKRVFKQLGDKFGSYTYTDISTGFFETAREVFGAQKSKMIFRPLNIENDPIEQDFVEHSYDLIVASLVLHATKEMEKTMINVRRLLKPGGRLIMLEFVRDQIWSSLIFGPLPGWWMGYDEGRKLSPSMSIEAWDECLKNTGFSGADAVVPYQPNMPISLAVLSSQAVDDRVNFLRSPLTPGPLEITSPDLLIIGGSTHRVSGLAKRCADSLTSFYKNIKMVNSFEDLVSVEVPFMGTVLNLSDLDEPMFTNMTTGKIDGAKKLFEQSKTCLWITQGAKHVDPFQNMSVGFGRTVNLEMPHLRLQFLGFLIADEVAADIITEKILQLEAYDTWEQMGHQNLLWSVEPEIAYEKGNYLIPRIVPNPIRNGRYNSVRRFITKDMDPRTSPLSLQWSGKEFEVREAHEDPVELFAGPRDSIQIDYSTLQAVKITSTDYLYLVLGTHARTKELVFALSPHRKSVVLAPSSWTMPYHASLEEALSFMPILQNHLAALAVVAEFSAGETLVFLEPDHDFANIFSAIASQKGIKVVNLTTEPSTKRHGWVSIHPNAPRRLIKSILPKKVSCFINNLDYGKLGSRISTCFPRETQLKHENFLAAKEAQLDEVSSMAFIPSAFRSAWVKAHQQVFEVVEPVVITADQISPESQHAKNTALFQWSATPTVPVKVTAVDAQNLFSPSKTYWLVGLSGGLGLSLCCWMIEHGAKYVVITSRNPKVDPKWMADMEARGAVVKIIANDITNRDSVRSVYKKMCDELPPVGGVAQGAMVLQDTMISDMDLERVQNVLRPKVDGSIYLDEIFSETPLEFFIFFSSSVYVIGNRGQSIYAAANGYMTALAAQRRKRNLAGSVIHIGAIVGNGYVTRELNLEQVRFLKKVGNLLMSEQDFHQIFAEGVIAGREDLDFTPEVYTGLRRAYMGDADQPGWFDNPQFSHCVSMPESDGGMGMVMKQNISVKAQLLTATTPEEIQEIIQDSFVDKLQSTLQTDPSISILDKHTDELGIDSLVAVDIRSWFIKELNVEMPILKILGGFTPAELVAEAREKIPESLVPNLGKEIDEALKTAAKAQRIAPVVERKIVPVENNFKAFEEEDENDQAQTVASMIIPAPKMSAVVSRATTEFKSSSSSSGSSKDGGIDSTHTPALSSATSADYTFSKVFDGLFERVVPMSFGQSRFWFLQHYLSGATTFNITTSIRLNGPLRIDDFSKAVKTVAARHEALRTSFFTDRGNQGMQGVLRTSPLYLEHKDIKNPAEIAMEYERIRNYHYDLSRGETMKIIMLSLSKTLHHMIIGYHHINMDGMSLEVLVAELQLCYNGEPLPAVIQYPDFSIQQHKQHSRGQWHQEIDFWKREFATIPPPLSIFPLSAKKTRSSLTSYKFNNARFRIDSATTAQIQAACRKTGASAFHFFLATFKTLLLRHTGDEDDDICIGMADGGRNNDNVVNSMGFFLNLLPLRFKPESSQTFNDALKEARSKVLAALQNSAVPFDILLNETNTPRSTTHNPLFQAFINYRPGIQEKRQYCGCESEATDYDSSQTAYDISIDIIDNSGGGALVVVQGQSDLYSQSNVDTIADSYLGLLKSFAKFPASRLNRPALYDARATQHAINIARGPSRPSQWPETLVHRIDEITAKFGSNIALKSGQSTLTYQQMSRRINSIASSLVSHQLGKGSRIGVFQEPSTDFYCSLLAVLRIGAIFIPLEPRLTPPRIALIVQDSALDAVIFDKVNKKDITSVGSGFKKIDISTILTKVSPQVPNSAIGNSTAIIMYTSGSTGAPKGILLRHSGWVNQTESSSETWKPAFGSGVHLQSSSWSFDMSLSQTFIALCNGATLLSVPKEKHGDSLAIARMIVSEGVTVTHATPWEYVNWISSSHLISLQCSQWKIAVTAGEKPSHAQIREFRRLGKQDLKLLNLYGPTEITFGMGSADIQYHTADDLETPQTLFPNYSIYILDPKMQPVPVGIPGEIYIGGAGIAEGYLNNESLSDERFPTDDFAPPEYLQNNWVKMHRSGDRGRLSANGSLIVEGRVEGDTQIKLRGIRIDLRDIESTIIQQSSGNIKDAIVSLRKMDSADARFLVAHVVMSSTFSGNSGAFLEKSRLSLPLPQYMQPSMIIALDSFPINHSRKVDRKAISNLPLLPGKQKPSASAPSAPRPRQSSETRLKDLWHQVLGIDVASQYHIDSESNFFHVGGSSSGLIGLQGLIKMTFGVEVALVHLFENPTLGAMMRQIDPTVNTTSVDELVPAALAPVIESHSQEISSADAIDWDLETAIPNDLYELEMNSLPKDIDIPFKTVVITGSTGFLGKELLTRMVADENIEKIYAIAVRKTKSDLPAIFSDPKVEVHGGDLAAPLLGLSEDTAKEIFSVADSVIHNGSDVSFLKTYRTLEKSNVQSTRELVKLCLPYRVSLHFISSSGVAHLSNKEAVGEESLAAFEPPTDGSDGYTATKWASERFLELVGEKFSMAIYIHRPSSITGDDAPIMDLMTNMLTYSKKMHKTPKSSTWKGVLDFVSVENVARGLLDQVHNENLPPSGIVKYLHQSGDLEVPIESMQSFLEKETGEVFETLSVERWVREATKEGMNELIGAYLISAADLPITFPKLLKSRCLSKGAGSKVLEQPSSWFSLRFW